jgi:hypothetical protein
MSRHFKTLFDALLAGLIIVGILYGFASLGMLDL